MSYVCGLWKMLSFRCHSVCPYFTMCQTFLHRNGPFPWGGCGSPSNTMWHWPRPTSVPNGISIRPAVWAQLMSVTDRQTDGRSSSKEPLYCVARLKADLLYATGFFLVQSDCVRIKGSKEKRKARPSTWNWEGLRCLDSDFFVSVASEQAQAESCDQHGRKSTKSIGNRPSRVES